LNHRRRLLSVALAILTAGTFSCHEKKAAPPVQLRDPEITVDENSGGKARLAVDVCLDATPSMWGFARDQDTVYLRLLDELEAVVQNGFNAASVRYFKFGQRIRQVERTEFKLVRTEAFYREPGMFKDTDIEKVFTRDHETPGGANDRDRITIIVTDLFQHDRDINLVTEAIRANCLSRMCSVGILPVLSQFDGLVYDAKVPAFPYRSGAGESTFRPFYLLMFGDQGRMQELVSVLSSKEYVKRDRFLLIPPRIVTHYTIDVRKAPGDDGRSLNAVTSSGGAGTFAFAVKKDAAGGALLAKVTTALCASCPSFDPAKVEFAAFSTKDHRRKETSELRLESLDPTATGLSARLRLMPEGGKGDHPYDIVFRTGRLSPFLVPSWVDSLSSDNPTSEHDATRTLNFRQFVERLLDANAALNQPPVAKASLLVKKLG
jgi:hypothetical protein